MNETKMIENELELLEQVESLRAEIKASRQERRSHADSGAGGTRDDLTETRDKAKAKVERLAVEKAEAKARLGSLNARLDAGDESVGVEDVMTEEKVVERLARLEKPAQKALIAAEAKVRPLLSDDHMAHFAADVIESVTDVPVVLRKKPVDAPDVAPLIVLSQASPTEGWGRLDVGGYVGMSITGNANIDLRVVRQAFADTGSKVSVTSTGIDIEEAIFDLPKLSRVVPAPLTNIANVIAGKWCEVVNTTRVLSEDKSHMTSGEGYGEALTARLVSAEDGIAQGEVTVSLGTSLRWFDRERFKGQVGDVLRSIKGSLDYTAMGKVIDLEIEDMTIDHDPDWGGKFYGGLPKTYTVTIKVSAAYEPVGT